MREMDLTEIQQCCLGILNYFNEYAEQNNIRYYLAGGTLLGAVRHKGFIPWDDDVDIMVPRPDYERLIRDFSSDKYSIISCEYNRDYNTPFARIWDMNTSIVFDHFNNTNFGAFIDVFPIDGYPTNEWINRIHVYRLKWDRMIINVTSKKSFYNYEKFVTIKKIIKKFATKDANYYCRKMNLYAKKYPYNESRFVGVTTTTVHIFSERNSSDIFKETEWMKFEDLLLPAPSGWDIYLKHLYGNYMELPPEEKRHSEHSYRIYWRS